MTAKGEPFKDGDPLRAEWDPAKRKGQPGAIAFDALQRYALVRFPGAAERIAERDEQGLQDSQNGIGSPLEGHRAVSSRQSGL